MYEDRIEGGFIDNGIEGSFREVHGFDIHEHVFEVISFFFVFFFHGFDANIRNIDIRDIGISFFKHFLTESRISCPDVEYSVSFIDVCGNDVLESTETLVPIERFRISESCVIYLVYLSSQ